MSGSKSRIEGIKHTIEEATEEWVRETAADIGVDPRRVFPWPQIPESLEVSISSRRRTTIHLRASVPVEIEVGPWTQWTWHFKAHNVRYRETCKIELQWITQYKPDPTKTSPPEGSKIMTMLKGRKYKREGKRWLRMRVLDGNPGTFILLDKDV